MIQTLLKYIFSLAMILLALSLGNIIQHWLNISVPGSIIGMILLFLAMMSGIISPEWIKPTANVFIRYMVILFIPISVGLIDHYEMLANNAFPILVSVVGGTLVMIVFLALVLQKSLKEDS
ncbi:CidA/LrgA family protein [Vibrio sp. TH_r3]|uniref:CidA/LrgA family protein n=1 Tax=Vibrio sp. TH_r3 TaxID=3082084 RepID=UPI0029536F74|nr:CidA/LrgA family protein [Vibrio sp. TH_r3]MDV7104328.1 CidA/LrgA family protein [Vibrio sp. TH_r3]